MFSNEHVVSIRVWELLASVEAHAKGGDVWPKLDHRWHELLALSLRSKFRVGRVPLMAVRKAEMLTGLLDVIELVTRQIIAELVPSIVVEPQGMVVRTPVEAHSAPTPAH